ncbi:MAG: efflux RND transporter periplasmic adaptor subunit [Magnetospirillum sp. WYHS-4]
MKRSLRWLPVLLIGLVSPAMAADSQAPRLRGLLAPRSESSLSAQLNAIIAEIPVRAGDRFRKGDMLVRFDCAIQKAQLQKAQADLNGARKTLSVKRELARLSSVSDLELAMAEAEAGKAEAEVAMASAVVSYCLLKAPFDGRVVELKAHAHEGYSAGQKLMDIIEDGEVEVEVIVPSRWMEWLKSGAPFSLRLDETGKTYSAVVTKLGARVDAVSQSIKIYGAVKDKAPELVPGMSGEVAFPQDPK